MTDFPIDTVIFNKIVEVFNQTRSYVLLLFPLAFFIRIAFGFMLLKGDGFTDILKDSLFLFLGLVLFYRHFKNDPSNSLFCIPGTFLWRVEEYKSWRWNFHEGH